MSHRLHFLNLVTRNWVTDVYSLHRIDLHSSHNNLFYPTADQTSGCTIVGCALF